MSLLLLVSTVLATGTPAAAPPPAMPEARFVLVELEKLARQSPAAESFRSDLERKQRELNAKLMPYAASFATFRPAPANDAERATREVEDRKAFALRDALGKELEQYQRSRMPSLRTALARAAAPKAKASGIDHVLDVGVMPQWWYPTPATSEFDAPGPYTADLIHACRLLRVDFSVLAAGTPEGKKSLAALEAKQQELRQGVEQKRLTATFAEQEWKEEQRKATGRLAGELASLVSEATGAAPVCLVEGRTLPDGVLLEPQKGVFARLPDSSAWLIDNHAKLRMAVSRARQEAEDLAAIWPAAVRQWGTTVIDGDATPWRGAPRDPPPPGFASAWTSTQQLHTAADVVVGVDAAGGAVGRAVIVRGTSLEDARKAFEELGGHVHGWANDAGWQSSRELPDGILAEGVRAAIVWGRPPPDKRELRLFSSPEAMRQRAAGGLQLTVEPDGDRWQVILTFAQRSIPLPIKPGLIPE